MNQVFESNKKTRGIISLGFMVNCLWMFVINTSSINYKLLTINYIITLVFPQCRCFGIGAMLLSNQGEDDECYQLLLFETFYCHRCHLMSFRTELSNALRGTFPHLHFVDDPCIVAVYGCSPTREDLIKLLAARARKGDHIQVLGQIFSLLNVNYYCELIMTFRAIDQPGISCLTCSSFSSHQQLPPLISHR